MVLPNQKPNVRRKKNAHSKSACFSLHHANNFACLLGLVFVLTSQHACSAPVKLQEGTSDSQGFDYGQVSMNRNSWCWLDWRHVMVLQLNGIPFVKLIKGHRCCENIYRTERTLANLCHSQIHVHWFLGRWKWVHAWSWTATPFGPKHTTMLMELRASTGWMFVEMKLPRENGVVQLMSQSQTCRRPWMQLLTTSLWVACWGKHTHTHIHIHMHIHNGTLTLEGTLLTQCLYDERLKALPKKRWKCTKFQKTSQKIVQRVLKSFY